MGTAKYLRTVQGQYISVTFIRIVGHAVDIIMLNLLFLHLLNVYPLHLNWWPAGPSGIGHFERDGLVLLEHLESNVSNFQEVGEKILPPPSGVMKPNPSHHRTT
jgi:hypothetical protein